MNCRCLLSIELIFWYYAKTVGADFAPANHASMNRAINIAINIAYYVGQAFFDVIGGPHTVEAWVIFSDGSTLTFCESFYWWCIILKTVLEVHKLNSQYHMNADNLTLPLIAFINFRAVFIYVSP